MGGIVELARRRVPRPPKPIFDHFSNDRSLPDRPDATERCRRRQAAARCRRPDRHRQQTIAVVNPFRAAEQIDVETV